ncbi:MAG TPA: flagellar FlbD family protein [Bryocella sp.]|nr:flagellar FlbD family protein [Bryocella sp.]
MIQLTRLNSTRLAVNADLIQYVEEAPDTIITLVNGEKLVVRETAAQVIELVLAFRRSVGDSSVSLNSHLGRPSPAHNHGESDALISEDQRHG